MMSEAEVAAYLIHLTFRYDKLQDYRMATRKQFEHDYPIELNKELLRIAYAIDVVNNILTGNIKFEEGV